MMKLAGHIRSLTRYPVKSMQGESLEAAEVGFQGIPGDRRYAFVQADLNTVFPWLTGRELPVLVRYRPSFEDATPRPVLVITSPEGVRRPVESEELLAELSERSGRRLVLHSDHRGTYDIAQVSLISEATVRRLAEGAGLEPQASRFRMNIVVETVDGQPFAESGWVGRLVQLGDTARVVVTENDRRCAMVNIDPATAAVQPSSLKAVADLNNAIAGVYASVAAIGNVKVGDPIYLGDPVTA